MGIWRSMLLTAAMTIACAALSGCGSDEPVARTAQDGIEFGIWALDDRGQPEFIPTDGVPYAPDQAFGWRAEAAGSDEPVKWVERLRLPAAPRSWEGVAENPSVTVSEDGRTATTIGQAPPGEGYFGNVWYVELGDPPGDYEMTVELDDGREAKFRFRVGAASSAAADMAPGEVI